MMEFILGMATVVVLMITVLGLVMCIEEGKKTKTLIKTISKTNNDIMRKQDLIINEMGLDLNKQRQS